MSIRDAPLGVFMFLFCCSAASADVDTQISKSGCKRSVGCDYGTLPGVWVSNGSIGEQWRVLDDDCQLINYVAQYVKGGNHTHLNKLPSNLSVLYLSDSMDFNLLSDFCEASRGYITSNKNIQSKYHSYHSCLYNSSPMQQARLKMGHTYIITYSNQSIVTFPFKKMKWTGGVLKMGWHERFLMSKEGFLRDFGKDPDAVMVAGGFWDLFHWLDGIGNEGLNQSIRDSGAIPPQLLFQWMGNLSDAMRLAERLWPTATFMYHNYVHPQYNVENGKTHQQHLGSKRLVAEMNAAGMAVAQKHGFAQIDMNALVASFADPTQYLRDKLHPKPWLNLEVLNIILNIIADKGSIGKDSR